MRIIQSAREMQAQVEEWRRAGHTVGFVPTMGALHQGHLELCHRARSENEKFCASIFVNPLQFRVGEDLDKYPRPINHDMRLLREAGCDCLFYPAPDEMYGKPGETKTMVYVAELDSRWEGAARPGHFRGVATVVAKLFNIALPHRAYFGEKDYQQLQIIACMVRDLNFNLQVVPCATVRESDGLALSSRNVYLSPEERQAAPALYRALLAGARAAGEGVLSVNEVVERMRQEVETQPLLRVDYLVVVNASTLEPLETLEPGSPARGLVAAYAGTTRLIDNVAITAP